ncbi:hypothetical protein [Romboutsia lituseburensis]|uniref:Uncharacterized protein n=1 Tax=Romboutsia lituseburensis DSM 797 TaxID=1121325 RepID=A0A1G9LA77_9FIRM|nr:hypothetical protein [Romboutsia lituseburensis]CEH35232.1 Hypothetical protein RLITU_2655 [Romboutsia lituseburensis]SDL58852.1 hypothetical protein SAMN04515677_102469 [Romboutsia lituseburensis DSM 797]
MKILTLKQKLEKGKSLGGEVIYIKDDSALYGIDCVYEDQETKSVTLLRSKEESIKVNDFLQILEKLYASIGDTEIFVGKNEYIRDEQRQIKSVEFAQYELLKMLFINIE